MYALEHWNKRNVLKNDAFHHIRVYYIHINKYLNMVMQVMAKHMNQVDCIVPRFFVGMPREKNWKPISWVMRNVLNAKPNLPKVTYPMLSPTRASEPASSSGGSRCENNTCGDVWEALRPSFNSCMNTLPRTTSSSSRNMVLNTTVTLSAFASTYLFEHQS